MIHLLHHRRSRHNAAQDEANPTNVNSVHPAPLQDQLNKQRAAEVRLEAERKRLREALEAAEARATRVELGRRSLEGELQRLKLSVGDREAESQASQQRHDALIKQVCKKRNASATLKPPEAALQSDATQTFYTMHSFSVVSLKGETFSV